MLTKEEGQFLVNLARNTIEGRLTGKYKEIPLPDSDQLQKHRATFVTLKKKGQLRGCIGCLSAFEPLEKNIAANAINAAFHDHRFSPLALEELDDIHIDISILTPAERLEFKNSKELLNLLKPGIDGVILKAGSKRATFLPQVWEQLPTTELFLSHLCRKAGLVSDYWIDGSMEIEVYHVQSFEEEV